MDEIGIVFDRPERTYKFGEEVTGKVVIETTYDVSYDKVLLTWAWHTHGKGDRDNGPEEMLMLKAERTKIPRDEHLVLPFRFTAPEGPATYRGQEFNLDWYVTVTARRDYGSNVKCEEDFLLLGGKPTSAIGMGRRRVTVDKLPPQSALEPARFQGLQAAAAVDLPLNVKHRTVHEVLLSIGVIALIGSVWSFFVFRPPAILILYAAVAGVACILVSLVIANAYRRKIQLQLVDVEPNTVLPGGQLDCRLNLLVRREVHLDRIEAIITSQERVTYTQGTTTATSYHQLSRQGVEQRYGQDLTDGASIAFRCVLPVRATAPPTFVWSNNAIEWWVEFCVHLKGWPGVTRRVPITVLPRLNVGG